MLNKRYVYQFRLTHCPTGTIATYNIRQTVNSRLRR